MGDMTKLPSIGLIGRKRAGKDTAAQALVTTHGYVKMGFADPLRELALRVNPVVGSGMESWGLPAIRYADALDHLGYERAKDAYPELRRILQELGVGVRDVLGSDVWVSALVNRVRWGTAVPVVVTDVRFPNEASALQEEGFHLVRIRRPETDDSGDLHISETALDDYAADAVLVNDGTEADIQRAILDYLRDCA